MRFPPSLGQASSKESAPRGDPSVSSHKDRAGSPVEEGGFRIGGGGGKEEKYEGAEAI